MTTIEQGLDAMRKILDTGEWNPECEVIIDALLDAQREIKVRDEALDSLAIRLVYKHQLEPHRHKEYVDHALDAARKKVDDGS